MSKGLGEAGLARNSEGWTRIILEKPFGRDLKSAQELNEIVSRVFDENSVYRIDHYLGKETVQNIMMFRFGNSIFEPVWNRNYVEYIEITAAETLGVEGRGEFYEETGALRDMVANHMLQLLMLTAMEPPVAFDADTVRRPEGAGAARDPAHDEGGGREVSPCAASTGRERSTASLCRVIVRSRASIRIR